MRKPGPFPLFLVVLGISCGTGAPSRAQDKPGEKTDEKKDEKGEKTDKPAEKKKEEVKKFRLSVKDTFGTAEFVLNDAALWVPEVSFLGGEGGAFHDKIIVRKGAAEIEVPLEQVKEIKFKKDGLKEDRLPVTITFRDSSDKKGRELEGTVKANLQVKGKYELRDLSATLKVREIDTISVADAAQEKKDGK